MSASAIHFESLQTSTALAKYYVANFITPLEVVRVLNNAGIRYALIGAHGLSGWMQAPRATQDVDVIVASRQHKKARTALLQAFANLVAEERDAVTRLCDRTSGQVLIDLVRPTEPIYREVLQHTQQVTMANESYNIPTLEMALALKFAAMVSPNRADDKKYLDAHDFIRMVRVNEQIDAESLHRFGELVYEGGGSELSEKVRQVRAGQKLHL